jgi:peroxiredoxin
MRIKETFIILIVALLFIVAGGLWFAPGLLNPKAPDIGLTTIQGDKIRLNDLHGKPVLITFWATSCPGCLKEQPHLVELYKKLHPQGLEIIGIAMSYDPPNQVVALQKNRDLPYTIALDLDGSAAQSFDDVRLTPTSFLISPEGKIVFKKIGEMDMAKIERTINDMLKKKG